MFILRRITSEHRTLNTIIGENYSVVYNGSKDDQQEFDAMFKRMFVIDVKSNNYIREMKEEVYAFIISDSGSRCEPMYKKSYYYVMTESGKTFENISLK